MSLIIRSRIHPLVWKRCSGQSSNFVHKGAVCEDAIVPITTGRRVCHQVSGWFYSNMILSSSTFRWPAIPSRCTRADGLKVERNVRCTLSSSISGPGESATAERPAFNQDGGRRFSACKMLLVQDGDELMCWLLVQRIPVEVMLRRTTQKITPRTSQLVLHRNNNHGDGEGGIMVMDGGDEVDVKYDRTTGCCKCFVYTNKKYGEGANL